jgi:transcriptional antiterminator RfaH
MTLQWYTLHSHPNKEDLLWKQLLMREIECYYPRIRVHPVNPRARKILPYFPGYLFLCADLDKLGLSTLQWMPYSTGLVSFGGEPAAVPEAFIQELRKRVTEIADAGGPLFAALSPGDEVFIHTGPFAGYEAIFDMRLPGTERVRVLLKMLSQGREVPLELQAGSITAKKKRAP